MAARIPVSAVYSFQKIYNLNKTCQLKPGKGAGICWVMEPHLTNSDIIIFNINKYNKYKYNKY